MDPSNKKEEHSVENNLVNLEESYVIPSPTHDSALDGSQESEEELTHEFIDDDPELYVPGDYTRYTPERLYQELRYESDDCISDEWQELNKSDYAKVIFCDLYYHADSGSVGCKFQITDNVHEDPCDYIGLFRIGFESLTQCLVSKMLSKTKCEEDGKVISCDFLSEELPDIETGFYQFLYITRDKEICGASMPFEIKQTPTGDSSPDCVITEKGEDDFLLVRHSLEKKNQMLEELLAESQEKNRKLNATFETLTHQTDVTCRQREVVIEALQTAMEVLRQELVVKISAIQERDSTIKALEEEQIPTLNREISMKELMLSDKDNTIKELSQKIDAFNAQDNMIFAYQRQINSLQDELQRVKLVCSSLSDQSRIPLIMQLDDQKFMIKALEDSKQLALKEMNDLSESLSKRTVALNQLKHELNFCKAKVKELTEALDKRTEELEDASVELAAYKILKETPVPEIQQAELLQKTSAELNQSLQSEKQLAEELHKVTGELTECQQKLDQSLVTEREQAEELQEVNAELTECQEKLNKCQEYARQQAEELAKVSAELAECKQELQLTRESERKLFSDMTAEVGTVRTELSYYENEVNMLIEARKKDSTSHREKILVVQEAVKQCQDLQKELAISLFAEPALSSMQAMCQRKCETLANKGKVADIKILLEKVVNTDQEPQGNLPNSGSCKVNKKCLKKLENLHNVGSEDIAFINDLTERISHRESGLLLQVESVPESNINTVLKDSLLCVERIINALRSRLWSCSNWSSLISGYNREYADLPLDLQIETILAECISQYQIEILLEQVRKSDSEKLTSEQDKLKLETENSKCVSELEAKSAAVVKELQELKAQCTQLESVAAEKDTQVSKLSDKLCDKNSKCMLLEEELQDLRTHYGEQKTCLEENHAVCAQLKDECMKKDALIEFLKTEKGNLSSKQMQLQETVKEHTARLTEAAELYKKQFKEIEKLKKKLRKIKREPYQICASSETSDPPVVVLNDESKTSSPVHEIFYPARSSSDSDTGEHVSGDNNLREVKEKHSRAIRSSRKQHSDEKANQFKAALTRTKKCGTDHELKKSSTSKLGEVRRLLINLPRDLKQPMPPTVAVTPEVELYPIPCPMCDQEIHVSSKSTEALTSHLETQHHMSMCPICGHFFEESVPKKYLTYHIDGHFKNNEMARK